MDWHIEQLHLKFTHPLFNALVQSITEGVHISYGSVEWAIPLEIHTPPSVQHFGSIYHRGCTYLIWECTVSYFTWNSHPLCSTYWFILTQKGAYFMWECPVGYSIWYWYSLCSTYWFNLPQRVYTIHVEESSGLLGYSISNPYTPCGRFWESVLHGECEFSNAPTFCVIFR